MSDEPTRDDAARRLGALLDWIDSHTRQPGEPPLRQVVADHAREQLGRLDRGELP